MDISDVELSISSGTFHHIALYPLHLLSPFLSCGMLSVIYDVHCLYHAPPMNHIYLGMECYYFDNHFTTIMQGAHNSVKFLA